MLNKLWLSFFIIAAIAALIRLFFGDVEYILVVGDEWWHPIVHFFERDADVFSKMVTSLFDMARSSVDIILILLGTLTLWMGLLKIAEKSGIVELLARLLGPLFQRLMPEVPKGHPAIGLITLNFTANALGLDNAATPIGLKAMKSLQTLNLNKTVATNAQILFLVMNASSLTLLPITIFIFRAKYGAPEPTMVFLPILLATSVSTLTGLLSVAYMQRLKLLDPIVLLWFAAIGFFIGLFVCISVGLTSTSYELLNHFIYYIGLKDVSLTTFSSLLGNITLFSLIMVFLLVGAYRKVPVYDTFIEGAKEAFDVAKNLLPYLVAMLCAIGVLRASGALDFFLDMMRYSFSFLGADTRFVDALPTALVKPFSGSGARGMMIETMQHYGVDSFPSLVAATMQGSTETTFYVLAVYFGSVGIQRVRHAIGCALLCDVAGVVASILICYWFFT